MILTVTLNPAIDKVYEVNSFAVGSVFRSNKMWITAGGKGINVARVASILGAKVIATGFLGGGNGEFIRDQIQQLDIEDAFVQIAESTRTCMAINDPINKTSTEILEIGPTISLQEQNNFIESFKAIVPNVSIVTISGSLPKGISTTFYGKLIKICKENGKRVIFDTSGSGLADNLKYTPFMIKPNQQELETLIGKSLTEASMLKIAEEIQSTGIDIVCITLGAAGCLAVTKQGTFRLRGPQISPINTVGSGDSFIAGCSVALLHDLPIQEVLKTGMACGIANTQFAETGKVSPQLVEKFIKSIYQV